MFNQVDIEQVRFSYYKSEVNMFELTIVNTQKNA